MADPLAFAVFHFSQLLDAHSRAKDKVILPFVILPVQEELRNWQRELDERVSEGKNGSIYYEKRRQIARDITELHYCFENTLDARIINGSKADRRRLPERWFPICFPPTFPKDTRQILQKIKATRSRLRSRASGLSALEEGMTISGNVVTYRDHEFVGRMTEMEELRNYLCEDEMCRVITISGICGVGKTTLAEQLCEHDQDVWGRYDARIWITVSRKFKRRNILRAILGEVEPSQGHHIMLSEEELGKRISVKLNSHKVLIVLDDLWSWNDWLSLSIILPGVDSVEPISRLSKILITTREKQLAEKLQMNEGARAKWVHLNRLTEEDGRQLLVETVPDLIGRKDLQMKILNFCGGLPLTIVSLRSLASEHTLIELEEMVNQRLNCASNTRLELPEIRTTLEALAPSYDDLPHILKLYFLYMGVLQEDLQVEVEKLCLLALAERLITDEYRLFDVGAQRLNDLAERGMVDLDEGEVPTITGFKYCQLTEIMRDLSLFKNKDECFFKVVEFGHRSQPMPDSFSSLSGHRTYRFVINFDGHEEGYDFPLTHKEWKHIRVLLFSAKRERVWPSKLSSLAKFKYLRILDFNGFNFGKILPDGIATAVYLRYLSFKDCILRELPSSIGNLKLLYVLDLRVEQSTTMIIPDVLWKLKKLRSLYFPVLFKTHNGSKLRLHGLKYLEMIANYKARMFYVADLLEMKHLQYLDLNIDGSDLKEVEFIIRPMQMEVSRWWRPVSAHLPGTSGLMSISLEIRNFDCYTEERHYLFRELLARESLRTLCMDGYIRRIPMYRKFSPNLIEIEFIGSELIEDPMKTLEKLPNLRGLVLNDAFEGKKIVCSTSGFLELRRLRLLNLQHLKNWVVENGTMPKLSTLEVANCGKLEIWPEGLEKLPKLRELVLDDAFVGEEIVCSASGFIELRLLRLLNLQHLKNWVVEDGAMPKLSSLAIVKCGELEMLPEGLRYVRLLQELKVSGTSQDFKNRVTTGGDRYKVMHLPQVIFED